MCMQDLAIARNVTWRRIVDQLEQVGNQTRIPPTPFRVGLAVGGADGLNSVALRLGAPDGPVVNGQYFPWVPGTSFGGGPISLLQMSAYQTCYFWIDALPANCQVWEAVVDPGLGAAVERLAAELRQLGGK